MTKPRFTLDDANLVGQTGPFWYTESQGEERDREILKRYETIIDYFAEHPERAYAPKNFEILMGLLFNDPLMRNSALYNTWFNTRINREILNCPKRLAFEAKYGRVTGVDKDGELIWEPIPKEELEGVKR